MPKKMPDPLLLYLLLPSILSVSGSVSPLSQHNSCSYRADTNTVQCKCRGEDGVDMITMDKDLLLNKDQQKVEHVMIDSCPSVLLSLDLNSHKITNITLKITNCGNVKIVNIKYDPIFSGQQVVNIELENLDTFTLQQLEIDDALMISLKNVGSVLIYKTIFSQLSSHGMTMENTGKVSIIDSVFNNTASGSIIVDTANEVEIVNNQFSIDTLEVLKMMESQHLYISCNRLIGEAINVECSTISSDLQTLSSRRSSPDSTMPSLTAASLNIKSEKQDSTSMNTILWVLVAVGLLVLSVIFLCICCRRRQHQKQKDEEKSAFKSQIKTEKIEYEKNEEKAVMLPPE